MDHGLHFELKLNLFGKKTVIEKASYIFIIQVIKLIF
jgi:hypothetical protein